MIIRELKAASFNRASLLSVLLLTACVIASPYVLDYIQEDRPDLLIKRLTSRLFLGSGFLRQWFMHLHLLVGCILVPMTIVQNRFSSKQFHRSLWICHVRGGSARSLITVRYLGVLITALAITVLTHVTAYIRFVTAGRIIVVPIYLAVAYLNTLAAMFTVSWMSTVSTLARNIHAASAAGLLSALALLAPLYLDIPVLVKLRPLSPFYYATYILQSGPGDMLHFVHAATILFVFILIPYFITLRLLTDRKWLLHLVKNRTD